MGAETFLNQREGIFVLRTDQLLHADIVLSSTSSPHPIVGREELELVMAERRGRPLLCVLASCIEPPRKSTNVRAIGSPNPYLRARHC